MKSVLLIGLNNFGILTAKQLQNLGHEVMAVDRDENRVNTVLPVVTDAQIGDSTNEDFLKGLGINNYDLCIVAITNDFQSSLVTTALLKEMGAKMVISRADSEIQKGFLLRNGADAVINPEKQIAEWVAVRYGSDHILDYIRIDDDHAVYEVVVPEKWVGKTIGQLDLPRKYELHIVAVRRKGEMDLSFTDETVLDGSETLLVLGEHRAVQRCFRI